ncbi:TPA: hypothetical protein QC128_004524 [Bacillus cereus]|nr:hypothetical protein [Bacillus cereus]HDR8266803.1 hypothetical protein [Bacillus cereus]HDR8271978.1 hypothetical protein [Bacillus cereus]HDR8277346.1 hypothetical protein [Bacillus cereus]HDR8282812.1 hypothetical protein [Bacillus cereus]
MSIQYPYNNNYYPSTTNQEYPPQIQPQFNENQLNIRQHEQESQDCLMYPPRRSPEGFRWIRIYPYFMWNGHYWVSRNVTPHWGLIDELHPCNPHTPQ